MSVLLEKEMDKKSKDQQSDSASLAGTQSGSHGGQREGAKVPSSFLDIPRSQDHGAPGGNGDNDTATEADQQKSQHYEGKIHKDILEHEDKIIRI